MSDTPEIAIAREVLKSIAARKLEMERTMNPLPDVAWQYASGMVRGASEVLAALVKARG